MKMHNDLKHLCNITNKKRLEIDITLHTEIRQYDALEDKVDLYKLLEVVRWPMYGLMHAGSRISVLQTNGHPGSCEYQSMRYLVRDGRGQMFFGLTAEEWSEVCEVFAQIWPSARSTHISL